MSNSLNEYNGALRYAFSEAGGGTGKPADWSAQGWTVNDQGQTICDFRNEKENIVLRVTDEGEDTGFRKFHVEGDGIQANMSVPALWKNLKV